MFLVGCVASAPVLQTLQGLSQLQASIPSQTATLTEGLDLDTALVIKRVPLDSLKLDPANARAHGERNLEAIVASLQRFGQAEPLVVHAPTGRVIGGNGRTSRDDTTGTAPANDEADSPADSFGPSAGGCGGLGMISLFVLIVGLIGLRSTRPRQQ